MLVRAVALFAPLLHHEQTSDHLEVVVEGSGGGLGGERVVGRVVQWRHVLLGVVVNWWKRGKWWRQGWRGEQWVDGSEGVSTISLPPLLLSQEKTKECSACKGRY